MNLKRRISHKQLLLAAPKYYNEFSRGRLLFYAFEEYSSARFWAMKLIKDVGVL